MPGRAPAARPSSVRCRSARGRRSDPTSLLLAQLAPVPRTPRQPRARHGRRIGPLRASGTRRSPAGLLIDHRGHRGRPPWRPRGSRSTSGPSRMPEGCGFERARRRVGEEGLDVLEGGRAVLLQRQQVVAAAAQDGRGDPGLGADGVDRHQGALERQLLQKQRDGGDLVRLATHRLLPEHQALAGRQAETRCRDRGLAPRVGAPRGLAVDRDEVRLGLAQAFDPRREAGLERLGVERGDHLAQRVVARHPVLAGQEATEEGEVCRAHDRPIDPGRPRGAASAHLPRALGARLGGEHREVPEQ